MKPVAAATTLDLRISPTSDAGNWTFVEVVGEVVVGLGGVLEGRADRRLDRLTDHKCGRHERQPDHQRGRGRGGATRVASGVLLGEAAGHAGDLAHRPSEEAGHSLDRHRAEQGDTHEDGDRTERQPGDRDRRRADPGQAGRAGDQSGSEQTEASDLAGARPSGPGFCAATENCDRGDRGRSSGRTDCSQHRDPDTDHCGCDQGALGEDERVFAEVDSHHSEKGINALGDGDAAGDTPYRGDHAYDQSLTQDRTPNLLRDRHRRCAAVRARDCAATRRWRRCCR